MAGVRPRHFGIVVSDLDRALTFYQGLLGLRVSRQMDEWGPFIEQVLGLPKVRVTTVKLEAETGQTQVELLRFHSHEDAHPRPPEPYFVGPTHMAFTVDDLDALHQKLVAVGTPFVSFPQLSPDGRAKVAFCRDPDGTLLELVELIGTSAK